MEKREVWKDVEGYEGIYQISSFGKVRGLGRTITNPSGRTFKLEKSEMSVFEVNGKHYCYLSEKDKCDTINVDELVAEYFKPEPKTKKPNNRNKSKRKKVYQYTKEGVFLKCYDSLESASKKVKTTAGNISQCYNERSKTAKGFVWKKERSKK